MPTYLRVPGLLPTLQVLGEVLVFIQVALAMETMLPWSSGTRPPKPRRP